MAQNRLSTWFFILFLLLSLPIFAQIDSVVLVRGPYLQLGTPTQMCIRWRTDKPSSSKVAYGSNPQNLAIYVANKELTYNHIITLKNLLPNTKYYYEIGSNEQKLGGDSSYFFVTTPTVGATSKMRFWVTGDCGNNSQNQRNVLSQYENYLGENYTNAWLLLGDNAYYNGLEDEYQYNFFDIYKNKMLKQTLLVPAPGNHDYAGNNNRQNDHKIPYYEIFSLPDSGQMGGVPSGTEAFYSYDYGNIHFISLDSYGREDYATRLYDTLGAQVQWLKADLAANKQPWTILYWHHPPYTMGSHNSDTEFQLVNIRQNLLRILERYKVDLVLCGHSHSYERSYLMQNYYGMEADFNKAIHAVDSSSGRYNGEQHSCPYVKNGDNAVGTLYVVSGSAGQLGGLQATFPHNAMYYSDVTNGGSLILEVEDNRLDAKWLCGDGEIRDNFTILKNVNQAHSIQVETGDIVRLKASWIGDYKWTTYENERGIAVSPSLPASYVVSDSLNCLKDEFYLFPTNPICSAEKNVMMLPNPAQKESAFLSYCLIEASEVSFSFVNVLGTEMLKIPTFKAEKGQNIFRLGDYTAKLPRGIYVVRMEAGGKICQEKCIFL